MFNLKEILHLEIEITAVDETAVVLTVDPPDLKVRNRPGAIFAADPKILTQISIRIGQRNGQRAVVIIWARRVVVIPMALRAEVTQITGDLAITPQTMPHPAEIILETAAVTQITATEMEMAAVLRTLGRRVGPSSNKRPALSYKLLRPLTLWPLLCAHLRVVVQIHTPTKNAKRPKHFTLL